MREYKCVETIEKYSVAYHVDKIEPDEKGYIYWHIYNADDINFEDMYIVTHQVFNQIEKYLFPIKFKKTNEYKKADIKIIFAPKNQKIDIKINDEETINIATPYVFDGAGGDLALAFMPFPGSKLRGVILFDKDEKWGLNDDESLNQIDFHTVLLHEVFHVLGIRHSDKKKAVMYASYEGEKRFLNIDDIIGLQLLYKNHINKISLLKNKLLYYIIYNPISNLFRFLIRKLNIK